MLTKFHVKYGYCEIPSGLRLYRSDTGLNSTDQLFFSTSFRDAWAWGGDMQLWTARKSMKILFLLRHINSFSKGESSLPDLYYDLYPNEPNKHLDDLDIKQDIKRRDPFAKELLKNNISGWFTTIEDGRTDFEICLFNKNELPNYFDCKPISREDGEKYYQESLMKMDIFPTETFLKNSRELIVSKMQLCDKGKDPFKLYEKRIKSLVADCLKEGRSSEYCEHEFYDIRLKFKI